MVVPLIFNGRTFVLDHHGASCNNAARPYVAHHPQHFVLGESVTFKPVCVPSTQSSQLFIAGAQAGGPGTPTFTPLGGPVGVNDHSWTFAPMASSIAMQAHGKYVFYVVSVPTTATPSPGPSQNPTGNFILLQPLSFDGTTFSLVPNACFHGDPEDAPPYVAPTSGPLTLSAAVTIAPTCVPSPLPS